MTPEIQSRIAVLRAKSADGTITLEELKEGVLLMREGRLVAASTTYSRKAKPKAHIPSADDMLGELGL